MYKYLCEDLCVTICNFEDEDVVACMYNACVGVRVCVCMCVCECVHEGMFA